MLSTLYLIALAGVGIALLAAVLEAVLSVSRRPRWPVARHRLQLVETVDRRTQDLPFVGADRRRANPDREDAAEVRRAA